MQKEIIVFSKFWMIEFIIFQLIVGAFKVCRFYFVKEFHLEWTLGLQVGIITLAIADYLLSKRFLVLALYFSNVQTILIILTAIEVPISAHETLEESDIFIVVTALVISAARISYCQKVLLLTYLSCSVFILLRSYFWISN